MISHPICNHDLSDIYIKDQLIKGTVNDALHIDLLENDHSLKTLEENINHAEVYEAALCDQAQVSRTLKMSALHASIYHKEKSWRYRFTMQHCPGKWHRSPDTISCNPVTMVQSLLDTFPIEPSPIDSDESDEICAATRLTALISISQLDGYPAITSLDCICFAGHKDTQYPLLSKTMVFQTVVKQRCLKYENTGKFVTASTMIMA